ncbi:DUF637 domain-containing protein [Providencia sp.]|uniref:endonuclease toxin domain-containing protein n=1 Tax=Providencia sp. TaxID=589 RepID=UPI0033410DDB
MSSTVNTTVQGGSFTDNFKNALLSNIGNQINAEGAKLIGDKGDILGHSGKLLGHSVVSGISAEIAGGNAKGAIVGSLAVQLAGITLNNNLINEKEWQKDSEKYAQLSRVLGGFAGAIFTGNAGGVYSGADSAESTFRFNHLLHELAMDFDREMQKCGKDLNCQSNTINQFAAFSNKNSFNLDVELKDNSLSVQELKKRYIENTFALAERPYWASYLGFDVMQNDLAKQYVQYWNSQDLAKIDTQTPSWIKFSSWVSDSENQLLVVSGGYLAKGLSDFTVNYFSRNSSIKTISASEIGMKWYSKGGGINTQGMSWEDAIAKTLPDRARLPKNFKTFDFYNAEQKIAVSAKSLDTQTLSKLNEPKQIYNSIKGNIDSAVKFDSYSLSGTSLRSDMIAKREIWLAVPNSTNKTQWAEINRAVSYGQGLGIEVKITQVK